ncbi:MAG TPA: SRPBCC domain-containing protein [Ramlibacter sp.]|nr:SRPBCC domain-containing protein [Ramlibacter sp.]
MSDPITVRVTHRYNVAAERVFDAWLTPSQAGRFLFATRTGNILHCEIDPRVGGSFTVTDRRPTADGDESFFDAQHRGEYVEIERPHRLAFDFSVEPYSDKPTRVTIDVVSMGTNMCEVVLTHELGDDETARVNAKRTENGWTTMLAQLDKVLNTRSWGGLGGFKAPGGG